VFYDVAKIYEPELYSDMKEWVIGNYGPKNPGKPDEVIWVKNAKQAFKPFRERNWNLSKDTLGAMESVAYAEANLFFRSFSAQGTASIIRKYMENK